jgi:hypothetical protein
MFKKVTVSLLVCAFALSLFPEALLADCGKMVVYVYVFPRPPRKPRRPNWEWCQQPTFPIPQQTLNWDVPDYGQGQQMQQQQSQDLVNSNSNSSNITINNNTGTVPPPPPAGDGVVAYGDNTFEERSQKALIAWNGKSDDSGIETLILATDEISKTGKPQAMLSVLPLPGKPISIERANVKAFVQAQILLDQKIKAKGGASTYGVVLHKKIGSHDIFIWKLDNAATFKEEVTAYIADKYDNKAAALITDKTLQVINQYFKKGFRYFAFDLTLVDGKESTKEAIAYTFHSTYAYYPLAISAIGGTGRSLADLVVMTPGKVELELTADFEAEAKTKGSKFTLIGNTSVDFTLDEVKSIDERLAKVFDDSGLNSVSVRNITIPIKDIGNFNADFGAVTAR